MPRLVPLKPYRLIRILETIGFVEVRQSGSHKIFEHADGRRTTVPFHANEEIDRKLLSRIIKHDLKITINDFLKLL